MRRTLLIVDENKQNRDELKALLASEYDCMEAAEGGEALDALCRGAGRIAAVLLDLDAPGTGGPALLSRIRDSGVPLPRPAVVATGRAEAEAEAAALELGAGDYLSRPYNAAVVRRRLRNAVSPREPAEEQSPAGQREAEQQSELLDNLPYGAALYRLDGARLSVVHLNKRYWELVGRKPYTTQSDAFLGSVHPDDRVHIRSRLSAAIAEKRDVELDLRVLYTEDEYRRFHITGRIIPRDDGVYSIYAVYSPVSDDTVSYREMLPVALSTVIGASSDLVFVKDKNLRYVCCNAAFAQMAGGHSIEEVIGRTDYDLLDRMLADRYAVGERELIKTGRARLDYEEPLPVSSGAMRYGSTSKYPLLDSAGNVIGIYGVTRDVTEYHAAYQRLKLITDSIDAGLATYVCTQSSVRIVYFNDAFGRLTGYTRAEFEVRAADDAFFMAEPQDMPLLFEQLGMLMEQGSSIRCTFRIRTKSGRRRWASFYGSLSERWGNAVTVNAAFFDVTEQMEITEQLRMSEEENRLAIAHSKNMVCKYDIASRTITLSPIIDPIFGFTTQTLANVPYGEVERGHISAETADAYVTFFETIMRGQRSASVTYQRKALDGWRWLEGHSSTIFSGDGKPVSAVISFFDVTEKLEKEAVYKKWQQSLQDKGPESYALFRCNLSKDASFDVKEGALLQFHLDESKRTFNERTRDFTDRFVLNEDKERYLAFVNTNALLASYYRGKRADSIDFRQKLPDGGIRWLRLSVELVEYPNSTDVEAYLMFEDIHDEKQAELLTREMAQTDALTGLYNRATFAALIEERMRELKPESRHALLMLDIDGFKQVNDAFGHAAGDQVLIDVADSLRTVLRSGDVVGRLGGDEFVIFLADIPNDAVAVNKAKQVCGLTRKAFSTEVEVSGSIGIALVPKDGIDFETLYKKADSALYYVKDSGRDNYAFYREDMAGQRLYVESSAVEPASVPIAKRKRRILVFDGGSLDSTALAAGFSDEYHVEKTKDSHAAFIRLRQYGSAISVVLLDMTAPEEKGFAILAKIQQNAELRTIPVIVLIEDGDPALSLRAIREGASDFIVKPVDPELLRIRIQSAISKADNERLRAKNSFLEYQNNEVARYRTVLEHSGILVVEYDWVNNRFIYDTAISKYIAGDFDERTLWHVLLSDMVADTETVKRMQTYVHDLAKRQHKAGGSILVQLKTPERELHWFSMSVYKVIDEFGLAGKLYLSFRDISIERDGF